MDFSHYSEFILKYQLTINHWLCCKKVRPAKVFLTYIIYKFSGVEQLLNLIIDLQEILAKGLKNLLSRPTNLFIYPGFIQFCILILHVIIHFRLNLKLIVFLLILKLNDFLLIWDLSIVKLILGLIQTYIDCSINNRVFVYLDLINNLIMWPINYFINLWFNQRFSLFNFDINLFFRKICRYFILWLFQEIIDCMIVQKSINLI